VVVMGKEGFGLFLSIHISWMGRKRRGWWRGNNTWTKYESI
jgi:hypothetical protein